MALLVDHVLLAIGYPQFGGALRRDVPARRSGRRPDVNERTV